jgi:hypothetical protein
VFSGRVVDSCLVCRDPSDSLFNSTCRGCDQVLFSEKEWDTCGQCLHPAHPDYNRCQGTFLKATVSHVLCYPNPANTVVFVCENHTFSGLHVELRNVEGKIVFEGITADTACLSIPAANWSPGLYYLLVKEQGRLVYTEKIVIH